MSSSGLPTLALDPAVAFTETAALAHEWMLGNGRGGYSSGTVALCNTRKYHGLLVASLPGRGRTQMLARLGERVRVGGGDEVTLDSLESAVTGLAVPGLQFLSGFELQGQVPTWRFELQGAVFLRRVLLVYGEETLYVTYEHVSGPELSWTLRPFVAFRSHEGPLVLNPPPPHGVRGGESVEVLAVPEAVPLRMRIAGAEGRFVETGVELGPLLYRTERARGYESQERLRSPGEFTVSSRAGTSFAFATTLGALPCIERLPVEVLDAEWARERALLALAPAGAREGTVARGVLAADPFIIHPLRDNLDQGWASSSGIELRSVIAGYPWFTDWGRDTMISLEGIALATGRTREAGAILRTFHHYIRDGLLPNYFPDGESAGVYHTADATLWFFHAISRYLAATADTVLLRDLYPALEDIVARHRKGTLFNIHVDPADGLLTQGAEGYQLTWMDAKVDGWVVTPRRGKAVELNALWFNALRLMAEWSTLLGRSPATYLAAAEQTEASFNRRFWNEPSRCLFDVVDGEGGRDDASVRPNQIFAISLTHPVLARTRWAAVMEKVSTELLTPVGLRTLAPGSPEYQSRYDGDLRARDAAYHQGTVWPWLLGHFVDASLKVTEDKAQARALLAGLEEHLQHACIGQVSEIFDATEPFRPRGCFAQAWSVAEFLRVWLRTC